MKSIPDADNTKVCGLFQVMNFEKSFQTANLSLICAGFLSILLTGTISITTAAIFLISPFSRMVPQTEKNIKNIPVAGHRTDPPDLSLLDLISFSHNMAPAVVRLMLALILLKVFTREEKRDYSTLFLLSFSLLLISSTSTISVFVCPFSSFAVLVYFCTLPDHV